MKKHIYLFLLFLVNWAVMAQSATQSYVTETIYKQGQAPGGLNIPTSTNFVTTTYYDGLGRPVQQVQQNASPVGDKNIVTHVEYEKNLGQTKNYLPFTAEGKVVTTYQFGGQTVTSTTYNSNYTSEAKQKTLTFYNTQSYENTVNPYSENRYEAAPSKKVLETAAPGNTWRLFSDYIDYAHTIRYQHDINVANEVKKFTITTVWDEARGVYTNTIYENGFYPANSLKKSVVKNENWQPGDNNNNTTEEFTGSDGKILLKRTYNKGQPHDTHYVYDFYGNLAYVIPPLANGSIAGANLEELCYQYLYDEKNRVVEKKQPQKQWEYIVYDKADRIVLTGPANNPFNTGAQSGWIMTKYDSQSRSLYTGFYSGHTVTAQNRKTIKDLVYAQTDSNEAKGNSNTIDGVSTNYTNVKFPTAFNLLTVNYYDGYSFPGAPTSFTAVQGVTPVQNVKGLATGGWVRVITTDAERKADVSYTLYNSKYQPIRTYSTNYLNGYIQTDNVLTFRGIPTQTITAQKKDAAAAVLTITNNYTYDGKERLKTHTQQINGGTAVTIAENVYDELGVLITKKVGGSSTTPLQNVDFKYNIRGWLTDINNIDIMANSLFSYKIGYNATFSYLGKDLYNGNICGVLTKTKTDNVLRGYEYYYDHLNRLTEANGIKQVITPWTNGFLAIGYNENLTYDKNGNILTLNRSTESIDAQPVEIDDLTYTYTANQLQTVTDATNSPEGFNDGNKVGTDYTYDAFGNLKTDKNKSITNITYNHLNLPVEITFATGKINYTYTAAGIKLKKVVQPNSGVAQTTDYLYGFQYLNGALQFFPHAEGYVKPNGTNSYLYVYQYKDHLGNVRLSYADCNGDGTINPATEILEENNYYPFGLQHQGYNDIANSCRSEEAEAYKLNGKEYEDSFGLNIYEMDLRQLDPAIGRWTVMDPVVHHDYSPYSAFDNNPVYWSDPSGADSNPADKLTFKGTEAVHYIFGMIYAMGEINDGQDMIALIMSFGSYEDYVNTVGKTGAFDSADENGDGSSDGKVVQNISEEPQNPIPQLLRALFRILTKAPKGKLAKQALKTSSKFSKITPKIAKQMERRGWTRESIHETVNNAYTTRGATNRATGNRATAYFRKDGSYIVRDNVTDEVIQVSNRLDPKWIPDATITNPYIPK